MTSSKSKREAKARSSDVAVADGSRIASWTSQAPVASSSRSAYSENAAVTQANSLPWKSIVHSTASDVPPVFTKDADYYFLASASSVQIHSRATGAVVSTLTPPASAYPDVTSPTPICAKHPGPITSLMLHPTNSLQLITASLDGTIKVWDFLDGLLLRSIGVGGPITHMTSHPSLKGSVVVVTRKPQAQGGVNGAPGKRPSAFSLEGMDEKDARARSNAIFSLVSLSAHKSQVPEKSSALVFTVRPASSKRIGKARAVSGLAITADGSWIVATGNRKLHIARLASLNDGFVKVVTDEIVTRLAMHPTENVFATGDVRGRIRLWPFLEDGTFWETAKATSGLGEEGADQRAASTLWHWHAHAVSALAFASDGAALLSGGEEAVLVLWSLQSSAREFIPRLGAPIAAIANAPATSESGADSQTGYAVTLRDGSFLLIGALNRKVVRTFAGVKMDVSRAFYTAAQQALLPAPFALEPGTNQLVFPAGHASSLQFYSPDAMTFNGELEVSPSNRISRPDELPIEPTRVERVAFSSSPSDVPLGVASEGTNRAEWMATIDGRSAGSELCLKIWHYEASAGRYVLNTRIDAPHEDRITSLCFSRAYFGATAESAPLLVTTGTDAKIKTWQLASHRVKGGRAERYWVVRSVFSYRDTVPTQAVFSSDTSSSVLAVSQGHFVTLWDTRTNALLDVLSCPEVRNVVGCAFVASDEQAKAPRYLAAYGNRTVALWDLVEAVTVYSANVGDDHVISIVPIPLHVDGTRSVDGVTVRFASVSTVKGRGFSRVRTHNYRTHNYIGADTASLTSDEASVTLPVFIRAVQPMLLSQSDMPSFYAITDSFDIVHVGVPPSAPGTAASIRSVDGTSAHRTLFDNLLGAKANTTWSPVAATTVPALPEHQSTARAGPDRLKHVMHILDAPPHLLPPIRLLAASLFDALLPPAAPKHADLLGNSIEEVVDAEGDEQMDLDDESGVPGVKQTDPTIALTRLETDIPFLTDLFRTQLTLPAASATRADASLRVNGATPQSKSTPRNGIGRRAGSSLMNGSSTKQQIDTPVSSPSMSMTPSISKSNGASGHLNSKLTPVVIIPASKIVQSGASGSTPGSGRKRKTTDY